MKDKLSVEKNIGGPFWAVVHIRFKGVTSQWLCGLFRWKASVLDAGLVLCNGLLAREQTHPFYRWGPDPLLIL